MATEIPASAEAKRRAYWRTNLTILAVLLAVWFLASFGCAILWADALDAFRIPGTGFKLGFWMGHQGSIYIFVLLIWIYIWLMNRLDRRYGAGEEFTHQGEDI
ncbi:MAG: DUF4212 domain-containing protein [Verrucomicrobiota bacterium]